jgi:hypothetical protein
VVTRVKVVEPVRLGKVITAALVYRVASSPVVAVVVKALLVEMHQIPLQAVLVVPVLLLLLLEHL